MCDPITLGGIALSTAGGIAQGQTQRAYVNEVNRQNRMAFERSRQARTDELARQSNFEAEAHDAFDRSLAGLTRDRSDASDDANAQEFVQTFENLTRVPAGEQGFLMPGQGESSVRVQDSVAREANGAAADAARRISALSRLTGMGGTQMQRGSTLTSGNDLVSTLNGLRRGSLGVSQFEQNIPAATVTPGSNILGELLSGIGGVMSSGAFSGGGLFGARPAGNVAPPPRPPGLGTPNFRPSPQPLFSFYG